MVRKRHFDDGRVEEVGIESDDPAPPTEQSAIFEHITGTGWRNTTQLAALENPVETT